MKSALIISNGVKQIMFTAETEEEEAILKLLSPNVDITVDIYENATMFDDIPPSSYGYLIGESQAGYNRAYKQKNSLMLVLRPKKESK